METLGKIIKVLCAFLMYISIPATGDISNDDWNIIYTLANSNSLTDAKISNIGVEGGTNNLQITYYPTSRDVQKTRINVLAFYITVKGKFPSINDCQYIETDPYGNIVGFMHTYSDWYYELSLDDLITQTISTFQSDSQSEPEPLPNNYASPQSSPRQPSSDCLAKCEEYNIGQEERNAWRLDHDQIEWPLMDCSQKCG